MTEEGSENTLINLNIFLPSFFFFVACLFDNLGSCIRDAGRSAKNTQ